ncbi:MAG: DUF1674 domain-containing protein [Cardiobacteriaceae bacterium]|nr:DUF1674 domain-containing protein [Cardiobacteriaceae bacterium]
MNPQKPHRYQPQPSDQTTQDTLNTVATEPNKPRPVEVGGPTGLEPTRYGDWERGGRCIDF